MSLPVEWQSEVLRLYGPSPKSQDFIDFLILKGADKQFDPEAARARFLKQLAKAFRNTFVVKEDGPHKGACLWGDSRDDNGQVTFGYIPSVEDVDLIRSMIQHEEQRKAGCDKKIALLNERLYNLEHQIRLPLGEAASTTEQQASSWA